MMSLFVYSSGCKRMEKKEPEEKMVPQASDTMKTKNDTIKEKKDTMETDTMKRPK